MKTKPTLSLITLAVMTALSVQAHAEDKPQTDDEAIEEITVLGKSVAYANNSTNVEMIQQQSAMTSVLSVVDNLPGVLINEGDTFGSDDWSTSISMRGFTLNKDEQQIGMTVDGIANGNSNYGGGAKANRYIDTENLAGVDVSQGTADIGSRSHEALGGTLDFTTINPGEEERMVFSVTKGDFDAQKLFARYETGEILDDTYAWVSVSTSSNSDWVDGSAQNTRDHVAAKVISTIESVDLTYYASYDDVHEDNYQRVSLEQFKQNPEWDRLTDEWTGVPYIDQAYRKGWSTLRENFFTYLQADFEVSEIEVSSNVYFHQNTGRGDWLPPYMLDVIDDGEGNANSELVSGNTGYGGDRTGKSYRIYFVDADGNKLSPTEGCQSNITFPYGGAGASASPNCHSTGAIPVGSYRHSHYGKERVGLNLDFTWDKNFGEFDNTLRGGLWYEDYSREERRDWHKIIDSHSGYRFDHTPYLVHYDRDNQVDTLMMYLEDTISYDIFTVNFGVKKFNVDLERKSRIANTTEQVNSDSNTLLSAGFVAQLPVDGLEVFAGYAENFAAIKDEVIERDETDVSLLEPETAENKDLGLRYNSDIIDASLVYYQIEFDNRITFYSADDPVTGINFTANSNGVYVNEGGVDSSGLEASVTYYPSENWSVFASLTSNDSTYVDGDNQGKTVVGSPDTMAVVSIDWSTDKYLAGFTNKWVGERYLKADNSEQLDAYSVADFYAGVTVENPAAGIENLQLRLTINNLFDESYLGSIADNNAWIGAPRTAAINASVTF